MPAVASEPEAASIVRGMMPGAGPQSRTATPRALR